jgi:hypothetical protein
LVKDSCLGIILTDLNLIQRNFKWKYRIIILELDLAIGTKRLLVLNTVDKEDAAYGTAFIDGNATITGLLTVYSLE